MNNGDPVRPGWQTTEFWVTAFIQIIHKRGNHEKRKRDPPLYIFLQKINLQTFFLFSRHFYILLFLNLVSILFVKNAD